MTTTNTAPMKKLKELYELWDAFGNTPVKSDGVIEEQFLHFESGTDRYDVWDWFECQNPLFIVGEVMMGIRHSSETPNLKPYFVKLSIQAGEYEKLSSHLVKAENEREAELQAVINEAHNKLIEENRSFYEEDYSFAYRAWYVLEVQSDEEYKVLEKYLTPYYSHSTQEESSNQKVLCDGFARHAVDEVLELAWRHFEKCRPLDSIDRDAVASLLIRNFEKLQSN